MDPALEHSAGTANDQPPTANGQQPTAISGFGDEISPDLTEQLDVLLGLDIRWLDLRGAWGRNVLAFDDAHLATLRRELAAREMGVSCVASPIGKAPVDGDMGEQLAGLERAMRIAEQVGTRLVRVFSYYIPDGDEPDNYREQVLERVGQLVRLAERAGIVLVHENESCIYGDSPARCHDLHATIDSPAFRAVWDPGNFVSTGYRPFADSWELLQPWIEVVHVKDTVAATGQIVPAGEGDAQWPESLVALRASGFSGPYALEPHLQVAGALGGFTGPDLFRVAADRFRGLLPH